jgi:hypothetical protein
MIRDDRYAELLNEDIRTRQSILEALQSDKVEYGQRPPNELWRGLVAVSNG